MNLEGKEEVVISGISGRFPKSANINELIANLISGKDCSTIDHERWKLDPMSKIPFRLGIISGLTKFDNFFFGISTIQAKNMAPELRIAMETTFEAIIDAGINPAELRDKKTNVYGVLSLYESDSYLIAGTGNRDGYTLTGYCRGLLANRISFFMDLIGSSCSIDSNCTSSALAIQKAYQAIKAGDCDNAIVCSGALSLLSKTSYQLSELGLLSSDGLNRSFDKNASGFLRSESIGTIFLQRAKDAKRVYAEVVNICVSYTPAISRKTCIFSTAEFQAQIMKQTLKQCSLKPSDVNYIEADGTAIKSMDLEELKAIDLVYGQDRSYSNPLLIGSIKSNIGYTFNNNTLNSIIKVLIAMETGVIPPNLHYSEPPEEAQCLQEGRVKVITKPTIWTDCYAAVNTAALNGSFSHIILKRHSKEKLGRKLSQNNMPRLFVASCRTQEMITSIFNTLHSNREDDEFAQLINDITEKPFPQSLYSGYTVIPESEVTNSEQSIEMIDNNLSLQSRQIWFVFSGMGSQWTGMGESLMKIPIFAEAIKRCDDVLRPRGYDIMHIICDKDPTIYDNIINCFLGIAAIQIGLVDILYAVGVKPNYMIGHSVGELGCSYADGCFTAEEMILSALSRGLASVESDLIHGTMAAVGLGYQQIRDICPEDIDVACHNGPESSTISGPTESINVFVKELQNKGIFAKTVPTNNIAYHSRYISPAGPKLLDYLKKVIPFPKERSSRWICTSIPQNEWLSMKAQFSSPEYHTNNLLSPVLFEEVIKLIPRNAITIEISPHGLLQAILKKTLKDNCINLTLTKRGNKDNSILLLSTLGKLYNLGLPIKPGKLYPRISFPVSKGTPSISSLCGWEHSFDWNVEADNAYEIQQTEELIDLDSDKFKFLRNFKMNDKVIISLAVYSKLVLNVYLNLNPHKHDNSIILENIINHNKLLKVPKDNKIHLIIMILKVSGKFEVKCKEGIMLASGTIRVAETEKKVIPEIILLKKETEFLNEEDIYSNLLLRGYQYEESYNIISRLSTSCTNGTFKWSSDWMLLLEGLIQVHIISSRNKNMLIPSRIEKLVIDLAQLTDKMKENNELSMRFDKQINVIACPGIEMIGIQFQEIIFDNSHWEIIADELRFIQNIDKTEMNIDDVLNVVLGIISTNISKKNIEKILVINDSKNKNENILEFLENIIQRTRKNLNIKLISREFLNQTMNEDFILTIINNAHYTDVRKFISNFGKESFLLTIIETEEEYNAISAFTSAGLNVVLQIKITSCLIALLLHKERNIGKTVVVNRETEKNCLDRLKVHLRDSKYDNVIFVVNTLIDNDIFEILRDIKRELGYKKLQIFDLQDEKAPKFSLENEFYKSQIKLNLPENVLASNGIWGTYRWMPLTIRTTSSSRQQAKINKSGSLIWMEKLPLIKEKNKTVVKVECSSFDLNVYEYCLKNDVSLESQISITEYSGTDEKGRRVMGLVDNLTISNEILPDPDLTWIIPESLSFEDAATIPQAYLAAFIILHSNKWRLKTIKTVLIHFGASDIGQALINLSLLYNFDVYTTYETEAEKRVIETIRPSLPQTHIINVNNYKSYILNITKGKGFDLVVSNYSVLHDMENCLDIVKDLKHLIMTYDYKGLSYNPIPLYNFDRNISIYGYCLQDLIKLPTKIKREAADLMRTALKMGSLKPIISRRLFLQGATEERSIDACERYGKVLVNLQEDKTLSNIISQFWFYSDKCYLVIDGFNIFGKVLIEWMIEQGVKKLIIASDMSIEDHECAVLKWRENGVTVIVRHEDDLSNVTCIEKLFKEVLTIGPLDGIFDLQRTKIDSSISSLKYFKVTEILDEYSRKLCLSHVKFFIFSSFDLNGDGLRDTNIEKLCKKRKESSLHGLIILLPNLLENAVADNKYKNVYYEKMSLLLKRLNSILCTESSIIAVRQLIKDNSVEGNEKNILVGETEKEQRSEEKDPQEEEVRQFEKYLYNYD